MRCALLVLALWSVGCGGSPLRASLDAWHPSGRVAPLDEGQRALLARMVTDTPTDDALTARERIDELPAIGDTEVRALLESSLAWLERVSDTELERLGSQACEANSVFVPRRDEGGGRVETRDVIGDLSSQDGEWVSSGVPVPVLARGTHMGLAETWNLHELRDAECARAYRTLRALAITRAWLGANVDDEGILEVFREAIERRRGRSAACETDDPTQIACALTRHFAELDPRPVDELRPHASSCALTTIVGPRRPVRCAPLAVARHAEPRPPSPTPEVVAPDIIGELARSAHHFEPESSRAVRPGEHAFATEILWGGLVFLVFVAQRGGQWRVVDVVYSGQVEVTGYTRG
jgi:hypothetical protein